MKNLITLFVLILLIKINFATDKVVPASEIIKPGTTLFYRVTANNSSYPFIVKIISMDINKGITFEYDMQSATPQKAKVELTAEALKNALTLNNYFNGKNLVLQNNIAVFLSTKMYDDLKNMHPKDGDPIRTTNLKLDAKDETALSFNYTDYKKIFTTTKGAFETNEMYNEDYNYTIRYAEDAKCPIITNMDLGWKVTLEKIE
jgi:hypothetical protein